MRRKDSFSALVALVTETLLLIEESEQYHTNKDVKATLREAQQAVSNAHRRLVSAIRRYVVAVVGLTNVGKSTLLNALLGGDFTPRRNGPCTEVPIEFVQGENLWVYAFYQQSSRRRSWACSTVSEVHSRLEQLGSDVKARAGLPLEKVVVALDSAILQNGLVIADTPGFGAAQSENTGSNQEEALRRYLLAAASQVFWVVLAEQGIGKREMQYHNRSFAEVCDDILITGSEGWDAVDQERFRSRYAKQFGLRMPRFHFVSGRAAVDALEADDAAAFASAGVPAIRQRILQLADPAGRHAAICSSLLSLGDDLQFWLSEFRDERGQPIEVWWRPDSWSRWLSRVPDCELKEEITGRLRRR